MPSLSPETKRSDETGSHTPITGPQKSIPGKSEQLHAVEEETGIEELLPDRLKYLADKDTIFKEVVEAVRGGWDNLGAKARQKILSLLKETVDSLYDYYDSRVNLQKASSKERQMQRAERDDYQQITQNADRRERIAHLAFIDSLNILSRAMSSCGLDNSWRGNSKIYDVSENGTIDKTRSWVLGIFSETAD